MVQLYIPGNFFTIFHFNITDEVPCQYDEEQAHRQKHIYPHDMAVESETYDGQ